MSDNSTHDSPTHDNPTHDSSGKFAKGNRGGPGRPRSAISRGAVVLDEMGAEVGKQLFQVLVDKALAGDMRATDMLLSRVWPTRRGRPFEIDVHPIKAMPDYLPAAANVTNAVMRGEMTPQEGRDMTSVIGMQCKALDYVEVERRLAEIERYQARHKATYGKAVVDDDEET